MHLSSHLPPLDSVDASDMIDIGIKVRFHLFDCDIIHCENPKGLLLKVWIKKRRNGKQNCGFVGK
jgi:hypothetical protein